MGLKAGSMEQLARRLEECQKRLSEAESELLEERKRAEFAEDACGSAVESMSCAIARSKEGVDRLTVDLLIS